MNTDRDPEITVTHNHIPQTQAVAANSTIGVRKMLERIENFAASGNGRTGQKKSFSSNVETLACEAAASDYSDRGSAFYALAVLEYEKRVARAKCLPKDYFGEPAWDILLDLYINKRKGVPVSVTSSCIASNVPPTTALRWINRLISDQLISRYLSGLDKRARLLQITPNGSERVESCLLDQVKKINCLTRGNALARPKIIAQERLSTS